MPLFSGFARRKLRLTEDYPTGMHGPYLRAVISLWMVPKQSSCESEKLVLNETGFVSFVESRQTCNEVAHLLVAFHENLARLPEL